MYRYGKTAQTAVSAMSHLAEVYDGGRTRLSSGDIAKHRNLSQPLVAKLMVVLSQAGLVEGTRGPGGGYWLARKPEAITLQDIVSHFEKSDNRTYCPFGPHWCGNEDPCPLHDQLVALDAQLNQFLSNNSLAIFAKAPAAMPPRILL